MTSKGSIRRMAIVMAGTLSIVAGFPAAAAQWNKRVNSWYLQTVATNSSGAVDDRSGVIGHISGGKAGFDEHDVPAFSSVSGAPVAVIFHQGDTWGEFAGEYLSDYRAPGKTKQVWDFTVTASNPDDTVTLSWDGLHVITKRVGGFDARLDQHNKGLQILRLVDLSLGEVVTRAANKDGSLATYTFQMGGVNERHFRWISGIPTQEELTSPNAVPVGAGALRSSAAGNKLRSLSAPTSQPVHGFPQPPALDTFDPDNAAQ